MKKEEAIQTITSCAKIYHQELENCNLLFLFGSSQKPASFEAVFLPQNFLHLTGVVPISGLGSSAFFEKCINRKLSPKDFEFGKNGTTEMKLSVLPQLMKIHNSAKMVGNYNNSKSLLVTDKLVGNTTACMGFIKRDYYYVPNTSLREDIRDITERPQQRVLAIFKKGIPEELYTAITYAIKDVSIDQYIFNSAILSKIQPHLIPTISKSETQDNSAVPEQITIKPSYDPVDLRLNTSEKLVQTPKISIHERLAAAKLKLAAQPQSSIRPHIKPPEK